MAKEHIYTRANEGFFTHAEGYDTVALSEGLTKEYIKKNIYPLCFYNKFNQDDETPDIYYYKCIHDNSNLSIIFGRNSYIQSSRNYISCSSIIISDKQEMELLYQNFEQFIEFDGYSEIPKLPAFLDEIDISKSLKNYNFLSERDLIFALFSIKENDYKCLLYNTIKAIEAKETFYIKLNCSKHLCNRYAKKLIKLLSFSLPQALKMRLSYLTYSPDACLKPFFNLVFLDNTADSNKFKKAELYFDFSNKPAFNKDIAFLNFAFINLIHYPSFIYKSDLYSYPFKNLFVEFDNVKADFFKTLNLNFKKLNLKTKLDLNKYFEIVDSFFILKDLYKGEAVCLASHLSNLLNSNRQNLKTEFKNLLPSEILNKYDSLIINCPITDKAIFSQIVYNYYFINFNDIKLIIDKLNNLSYTEDFFIISFFYLNYTDELIDNQAKEFLLSAIINKITSFESKPDIRKENINGLSVYLWQRYRNWL